jgi:bifunctional DNA-binding transcriptional regulator/antitoxin component of YhaV-PrlF toxin-antitoxin module
MDKVKRRKAPITTISSKHQITIPVETLREAELAPGDQLIARADGRGRVILERRQEVLERLSGSMTGVWAPGDLDRLRAEWD